MRAIVAAAGATLFADAAHAHPVHEVVQNAYLTLAPASVSLQLDLTAGPKVAGIIVRALDGDRDGRVTQVEAHAFADRVLMASRLTIDNRPVSLNIVSVDVPSIAAILGAHGTIRIAARARLAARRGVATLAYRNTYRPAESRCDVNVFFAPEEPARYRLLAQKHGRDGRTLAVRYVLG